MVDVLPLFCVDTPAAYEFEELDVLFLVGGVKVFYEFYLEPYRSSEEGGGGKYCVSMI